MEYIIVVIFFIVIFAIVMRHEKVEQPQPQVSPVEYVSSGATTTELPTAQRSLAELVQPKSSMPDPSIFVHYEAKTSLFSNRSELAFFHVLARALPPNFFLLTKPRLEDVIGVKKNLSNSKLAFQLRGRVKSRHVDFLVIDGHGKPYCGIELDGKSHKSEKAKAGDTLKNGIFEASSLTLHRVIVGQNFAAAAEEIVSKLFVKHNI